MTVEIDIEVFAMDPAILILPFVEQEGGCPRNPSPFTDVGAELVALLQRAGWDVPGIDVSFRTYAQKGRIYRSVSSISGISEHGPFRLSFGDGQHHPEPLGTHSTALSHLVVPPGIDADFYPDRSGPSVTLFLADDWVVDGRKMMRMHTYNARLEGLPKKYLKYSGSRLANLEPVNDSREYQPEGDEPAFLTVQDIVDRTAPFFQALKDRLGALPPAPGHDDVTEAGDANLRRIAHQEPIPLPSDFPVLYTWIEENDAYGLTGRYQRDEDFMGAVVRGNGWRLVTLGAGGHHKVPEAAYRGASYASTDPSRQDHHPRYSTKEHSLPARIELKNLNEIYVFDRAAYDDERARKTVLAEAEGREEFNPSELDWIEGAPARSLVPADKYAGGFKDPIYMIARRLLADEARLMTGRVTLREGDDGIRVGLIDGTTGEDVTLFESKENFRYARDRSKRVAERAGELLHGNRRNAYEAIHADGYEPPHDEPHDILGMLKKA